MKRAASSKMRRRRGTAVLVALALALSMTEVAPAGAAPDRGPLQTVVVQMASPGVRAAAVIGGRSGAAAVAAPQHRYLLQVPSTQVPSLLGRLRTDPRVSYASVPQAVHATVTPNDPCYTACLALGSIAANEQYLRTIGAPAAWAVTHGTGVTVAVLDSGVDATQPDLANKIASNVNICIRDDPGCAGSGDGLGHGTHVSGIVAANTNNGVGVASLGWGVKVDMYKVLDSDGVGNTADVATAIYDAVAAHVRVISMSLANFSCAADPNECGPDPDEEAAVEYALAHNVVVVAAAGNDGLDSPAYPASYPGVLSVAATDNGGSVQSFSQWGSAANIAAPGLDILSTWPAALCPPSPAPCYQLLSGTSMATPQVAAAAALMIAHDPALSGPQITEILESTARPTEGGNPIHGGLLDVPAALAAEAHPPHGFDGYDAVGSDGSVYSFGSTVHLGDLAGQPLARPVVGMALGSDGLGYWLAASDGGIVRFRRRPVLRVDGWYPAEPAGGGDGGDAGWPGVWVGGVGWGDLRVW